MPVGLIERGAYADLKPSIKLRVEGVDLNEDINHFVTDCQVDMTRDIADQISLTVVNPPAEAEGLGKLGGRDGSFVFIDDTMFQAGNRIEVEMGYGTETVFLAAGIIQRWMPSFPRDGLAVLKIKALDHSSLLMDGEKTNDGQTWQEVSHASIVEDVLKKYNINSFVIDVDDAVEPVTIKKHGMSDYKFLKGLANLRGYQFKVRWDPDANEPVAYWGTPKSVFPQEAEYTFAYNAGDESTLLDFDPQYAMRGTASAVKLTYWDDDTGTYELVPVEEDKETGALKYDGDGAPAGTTPEEIISSSAFRITAAGKSVEVFTDRMFQSPEQAQAWAEKWMQDQRDNFITAKGNVIGLETLRPGQVHTIEGVGTQLSGKYEFTTVTHKFDSNGYMCEFFAHKVLE